MPSRDTMGLDFGLESKDTCFKRKFRWTFSIPDVVSDPSGTGKVNCLPHVKGARPSLSFKEIEIPHLVETIYRPGKPEWKPINLTLYDLKANTNPVITWFQKLYNPQTGDYNTSGTSGVMVTATLNLYDGVGGVSEEWTLDNIWPQSIEFGELDMGSSDYVTVDLVLRYDRAYMTMNMSPI